MTRQSRFRTRAAGALAAWALLASAGAAQAQEHQHQHGQPQTAPPAQAPAGPAVDAPLANVKTEFSYGPLITDTALAGQVLERREVEIRIRMTDPATGRPLTGLSPMAWVDTRPGEGQTPVEQCRTKVGGFIEAGLMIKHGQINIAQPVEDLNGHFVLALARTPHVAVLDPVKGFGRTRMYTAVPLKTPGEDWAATPDERRLFVTMPASNEVAVVNTHTWRVEANVAAGARPTRAAMSPDGKFLWVTNDDGVQGGVTVIDAASLAVVGTVATGQGPHVVTFSDDGKFVFVGNRRAGTLTVVDAAARRSLGEVKAGDPVDVAWSAAKEMAFVASQSEGTVWVVDPAKVAVVDRIVFKPGLSFFRFAPEAGDHAHMGHGDGAAAPGGRLGFAVNPTAGEVQIVDVVAGRLIRTLGGAPQPDQIGFSPGFAYVRAAGTAAVAMIPLGNPTEGATGPHDYFPAGTDAPGTVAEGGLGDLIVPTPGGHHDAVYVANPKENMIYSFHYMEGMPVPHGGLTTYRFQPRAIRTVSRSVREEEPGVYVASFSIDRPGDYDVIFRVPEPHVLGCWGMTVKPDPRLHGSAAYQVAPAAAERSLKVGSNVLRFRVTDIQKDEAVADLADFRVQFAAPSGDQRRAEAKAVGGGVYEVTVDIPAEGIYYVSFEIESLGITYRDRSPITYNATNGN